MAYPDCELPQYKYCPLIPYEEAKTPLLEMEESLLLEKENTLEDNEKLRIEGNIKDIQQNIGHLNAQQANIDPCGSCLFQRLNL